MPDDLRLIGLARPRVHLNGTSRDGLLESYARQGNAIREALRVLEQEGPHPRDYPDWSERSVRSLDYQQALQQHLSRMEHLKRILEELDALTRWVANHA